MRTYNENTSTSSRFWQYNTLKINFEGLPEFEMEYIYIYVDYAEADKICQFFLWVRCPTHFGTPGEKQIPSFPRVLVASKTGALVLFSFLTLIIF